MAPVVEDLLSKHEALSSYPSTLKKKSNPLYQQTHEKVIIISVGVEKHLTKSNTHSLKKE
jgi:hypothetical protein